MDSMKALRAEIERFLIDAAMAPTRFGVEVDNDRHLVRRIRAGRPVTIAKAERIMRYIKQHKPARKPARKGQRRASSAFDLVA